MIHDTASHIPEVGSRGPDLLEDVEVLLNAGDYVLLGERLPASPEGDDADAHEARQGEPA